MKKSILQLLTVISLISCGSNGKKTDDQEKSVDNKTSDSTKIKNIGQSNSVGANKKLDTLQYLYVATLKDGQEKINAVINDSTIFVATKGQLFLYENVSHNAWIADGRLAYIPLDKIKKVDKPYFKFNFSKWDFVKSKDYALYQTATQLGADLNLLIKKIRNKDTEALNTFLNLGVQTDGAANEEFIWDLFALMNLWTDEEVFSFMTTLKGNKKSFFSKCLIQLIPISRKGDYYELFYPLTRKEICTTLKVEYL